MSKTKPIRIIAVRKSAAPAIVKKPVAEYDPSDIDFVVNMVNKAAREREKSRRAQAEQTRLSVIRRREDTVSRREDAVRMREQRIDDVSRMVNFTINAALVGSSVMGMMTALWFILTI